MITILGVGLGVSVSVAIRTANVDVLRSFEETVSAVAGRATLQVSGGELGLDESVITVLRRHPDVVSATPVLQHWKEREPGFRARHARILERLGSVPPYATAEQGGPIDVQPKERKRKSVTAPAGQEDP